MLADSERARFPISWSPDGSTSRYISGFSCEKGMVESKEAMLDLVKERKGLLKLYPNLATYEAKRDGERYAGDSRSDCHRQAFDHTLLDVAPTLGEVWCQKSPKQPGR